MMGGKYGYLREKTFFHQYYDISIEKLTIQQITLEVLLIYSVKAFNFLANNDVAFKEVILAFFLF